MFVTCTTEWYVENVFEELDHPNEYYYDQESSLLYYSPNATDDAATTATAGAAGRGPPTGRFEAVINQTIVKLMGTKARPVKDVKFAGITFRDSAYTYMEPHGVPSCGDWGLQRMGAIHLEVIAKLYSQRFLLVHWPQRLHRGPRA